MKVHQRHVYLLYVYDLPSHQQQITHVWKATTTYLSLTITELWDSVTRAQEINQFTTPQQTRKHLPVLDDVIEQWIPVQYEESQMQKTWCCENCCKLNLLLSDRMTLQLRNGYLNKTNKLPLPNFSQT